ncbi:MAG: nucleoside 2-deoxyribosyltransferase [Erysipelothrix sp.]|nr:nucleoside 2-deoxyribosyltransferase [Erysipelothrix sp.]
MKKVKVYFASPLFSAMEQEYNANVVKKLRAANPNLDIYLPQENMAINDKSLYADSLMIARGDNERLDDSDLLIAVLDGVAIDVGVATEIGYAYARGVKTIGLYTDVRQGLGATSDKIDALTSQVAENQFHYINLYTIGCIKDNGKIVVSLDELIKEVENL